MATVAKPVRTNIAMVHGIVLRRIAPSLPLRPVVLAPITMLAGAMALPIALPAAWAASTVATDRPLALARSTCSCEKITWDEVLLEVMNAPRRPMPLARNAKT